MRALTLADTEMRTCEEPLRPSSTLELAVVVLTSKANPVATGADAGRKPVSVAAVAGLSSSARAPAAVATRSRAMGRFLTTAVVAS